MCLRACRLRRHAPVDFEAPDNLALDKNGNLYITEDAPDPVVEGNDLGRRPVPGDSRGRSCRRPGRQVRQPHRGAEPSGIYFGKSGTRLFVNILHRGGNDTAGVSLLPDLGMLVSQEKGRR